MSESTGHPADFLYGALAQATSEQEIKRILVQRRASRLVLTETKDEKGNEVRGKVFVDRRYIHGYTPETIFFCPGCKCYEKEGEVVSCDFGTHDIRVEGAKKYYPWSYSHDFQIGDDIVQTPILSLKPEPPPKPHATLTLNRSVDEKGEEVRGKVFVDNKYIHGYTPEVIFFCSGCDCYKKAETGEVVPCGFGVHEIRVEGAEKYYPWEFSHDFQNGDDITKTPVLTEAPPGPRFDSVRFAEWKEHPATGKKSAYYNFKVKDITPDVHYRVYAMYEGRAVASAGFRSPKDTFLGQGYIVGDKIGFDGCKVELRLCEDHDPSVYLHKRSLTIPEVPPNLCGHLIVEECILPDSLFIEEPAEFIMRVKNCTEEEIPVQFRDTISFIGVNVDKEYNFRSEWGKEIIGEGSTCDLRITVTLRKSAIPKEKLGVLYDIHSKLEARVA